MRRLVLVLVTGLLLGVFPAEGAADSPAETSRVLRVKAVADEAFREKRNWEKNIRGHFEWADKKFRKFAGIGIELVAVEEWNTHESESMTLLLKELKAGAKKGGAEIVIGFTGHEAPELRIMFRGELIRIQFPFIAGIALPLGDRAVVRRTSFKKEIRHTLLHEIAHLFGGLHVKEKSILQTGSRRTDFVLDDFNRRVFALTRNRDFDQEARELPRPELEQLIDLYRERPLRDETDTDTYIRNAYLFLAAGDADAAMKELNAAMKEDPESTRPIVRDIIIPELAAFAEEHEPTTESRYALGAAYFSVENWYRAGRQLIPNCTQSDTHAQSCALLGGVYFRAEQLAPAERALARALSLDDTLVDAYNTLGSVYAVTGRTSEAIKRFNRAEELDPENTEVHFNKGLSYLIVGLTEPAADSFRKVLGLREDHERASMKLALSLALTGETKEARKRIRPFEKRKSLSPFFIRDMAEIYFLSGDSKRANKYLQFAKKGGINVDALEQQIQSGNKKLRKVKSADLIEQAEAYFRSERYDTATELLQKAVVQKPKDAKPHYWLGRVAGAKGNPKEAARHHHRAIEVDKKYPYPYRELAELAEEEEDYPAAAEHMDQYMNYQDSPGSYSYYLLGKYHYHLENMETAEENLRNAVQHRSDYGNAFYLLAKVYLKQERKKDAFSELKLAVESRSLASSWRPEANYELARLLLKEGDRKQAERYARIADRLGHPEAGSLLTELGGGLTANPN